jgi:hypothetical protein
MPASENLHRKGHSPARSFGLCSLKLDDLGRAADRGFIWW